MTTDHAEQKATAAAIDATPGALTRITFNATARTTAALTTIMAASGDNKTDAISNSLRAMATLRGLAHDDGALHVLARTARPTSCTCPDQAQPYIPESERTG